MDNLIVIHMERATCGEQGLTANQNVHGFVYRIRIPASPPLIKLWDCWPRDQAQVCGTCLRWFESNTAPKSNTLITQLVQSATLTKWKS